MARKKTQPVPTPAPFPADLGDAVLQEDCVAGMARLPPGCADVAFCDPPFNIKYEYDSYDDARKPADYLAWCHTWLAAAAVVLKPTGSLWLAISEEYVAELKVLAESRHSLASLPLRADAHRLYQRHHVLWYYTFGTACARKLTRSKTHLLHLVRDVENHAFYPMEVRVPSARELVYNDKRASKAGRLPDDTWILRPDQLPGGFQDGGHDVWHDSRVCGTFKEKFATPNQMPERLLARILRLTSAPGDLVVDCFSGSGTACAVAKKLGRRFVGFELDPGYAAIAQARVAAAKPGEMLDPPTVKEDAN